MIDLTPLAFLGWNEASLQNAMIYGLIGLSVYVALRAGMFSLAGVGFWGIGAYATGRLVIEGVPTLLAIAATLALTIVLGALLAIVLGRLRDLYLVMATFAFALLVEVIAREWDAVTGGSVGLLGIPVKFTTAGLALALAICTVIVIVTERGKGGRTLTAVRVDEQLARTLGIPVVRRRVAAFVFSCMLGALSGSIQALMFNIMTPDQVSFDLVVDALTMVVIGGAAAWYGPLIGAAIVIWLPEILRFTGDWRMLVQGVVVVLIVMYAPQGATGLIQRIGKLLKRWREPKLPRGTAVAVDSGQVTS
jgi:branched-chain amino acid transport system permease protein